MTRAPLTADRAQVIAYRILAQQMDRPVVEPSRLAVLELGVQDTPYGTARQALAVRAGRVVDDESLRLAWSLRGAPHLHRAADLPALAEALWPLSEADATIRISNPQIKAGAKLGIAAFTQTAAAFRKVVTGPMRKGEVSAAVSARIDQSLTYDCRSCQARHVSGGLFQQAGLAGGVGVRVDGSATVIEPLNPPVPPASVAVGTSRLIADYLRLLGPAGPAEVAKFLGTTQKHLRPIWPDDLVEVHVDGERTWLTSDRVDQFQNAAMPDLTRLLPPSDPYLQARDRALIVPDKARQAQVWKILGSPGAVLSGGEVVGVWRARMAGKRLAVTVTEFERLPATAKAEMTAEAELLRAVRGAADVEVRVES
ncbi:winged helix DNA-binding domain-containing protein [Nocardia sp. CNY236]|uniref:winged helix DNA-binding domain-containing protein n=1 Tax=Nocardia sp. CNY236 TaxID=1169152 RepID=UPI000422FCA4|nr:winged helix DNA-binding domain-containing protein [Nocardia sp. CNY236]